jgi:Cys-tRNA(Pro) deacylase
LSDLAASAADTPVTRALAGLGVPFRLFRHAGPVRSLEQAAAERGQRPEQVVRTILFRLARDEYCLVLVAGPAQLAWRALRAHLGQSRLSLAGEEEVRRVTGYAIGAVSPFGLPAPLRTLVDEGVFAETELSIGSGERGLTVILASADLRRALPAAEIGSFRDQGEGE